MINFNLSKFFFLSEFRFKDIFKQKKEPWQYLADIESFLANWFKNNRKQLINSKVNKNSYLLGKKIFIGKKTIIEPGVVIKEPVVIGNNCEVRKGAYLRGAVIIGDGCVIGNATEVKNSILLNNIFASHFNYIGDSILGNNVSLGAGAKLANLRFDNKNIKIFYKNKIINTALIKLGSIIGDNSLLGCNCVCNPGTILEKNCQVYPLSLAKGYYKAKSIIK